MALTALAIRNAQPRAKAYKLSDGRSLYLLVMPNGAKYWRLSYRFLGKQRALALGDRTAIKAVLHWYGRR